MSTTFAETKLRGGFTAMELASGQELYLAKPPPFSFSQENILVMLKLPAHLHSVIHGHVQVFYTII